MLRNISNWERHLEATPRYELAAIVTGLGILVVTMTVGAAGGEPGLRVLFAAVAVPALLLFLTYIYALARHHKLRRQLPEDKP